MLSSDRLIFRPFEAGGALFDSLTWETHILTPAAAIMYAALAEQFPAAPPLFTEAEAFLRGPLDVATDTPEVQQFLRFLHKVGGVR